MLPSVADLLRLSDFACAALRTTFTASGFDAQLVREAESYSPGMLRGPRLPLIRWWLERRDGPGAALARLFAFDDTLDEPTASRILGARLFDELIAAGVLARSSGGITSQYLLLPIQNGLFVLSDRLGRDPDAVMGPGGGTEHLGSLVPSGFSGSALDIGCGAGTLALIAARRGAARSVGVDLNPRAIELARMNARLNALAAEFHAGDGVDPVEGERFDLVLSQPPFVVKPKDHAGATFLFGGPTGDEIPFRFVAAVPRILAAGGRALVLMQSAERDGAPFATRVRAALGDAPVDVLALITRAPPPAVQASVFAGFEDPTLGERYGVIARGYLDTFAELAMEAFDGALIAISARADPSANQSNYTLGLKLSGSYYDSDALELYLRGLALHDAADVVLERASLGLAPHARLARELSTAQDPGEPAAVLRIDFPGIGSIWPLGVGELSVLAAVDGADSVGAALDRLAAGEVTKAPPPKQALLAFVRSALVRGALALRD
ncbi:MAG TPA: methyltransferase [Polyangiaceae bacterium]|nr:methyltransferase [Polyangiaceae bacterium]